MTEYNDDDEYELSDEMFKNALQELSKKGSKKYDFILKSGGSYKNALLQLYKSVWKSEIIPKAWTKTTIIQLYKGKGDQLDLNNYRNIHLKDCVPKLFGQKVMNEVKGKLMTNMSKFQLGPKLVIEPENTCLC